MTSTEDKIAARFDRDVGGAISVSSGTGGVAFKDAAQIMEFAKLMAISQQAVPKHLRNNPGMCLAVTVQALNWRMEPFAVANKSYSVNDRLAFEAQLISAVIRQRAPIKGRPKITFEGEGHSLRCTVSAIPKGEDEPVTYTSPPISQITVKNSPLWKADPEQQLSFYAVRAFARRHFPDVILGVYEREEIERAEPMRDVTPSRFEERLQAARKDVHDIDQTPAEAPEDASQDFSMSEEDAERMAAEARAASDRLAEDEDRTKQDEELPL